VLSGSGKLIRRVPRFTAYAQALEIAPDRRHAYVSLYAREQPPRLYQVDLETGQRARLANAISPSLSPEGTPPELVINWSPDARYVALFDGSVIRLVDVATATTVESQAAIPGGAGLAPVFLDRHTLVALTNCCIGRQHLRAIDLRSGAQTPFAEIDSPVESARRLNSQTILVVTALHRLVRVASGRQRVSPVACVS
jgi:hypothetical protein